MTILVTGATGTVGRHVVDRLVAAGRPARALTRNPETAGLPDGVDVVQGDLNRPGGLSFDGVQGVFLIPGNFDPAHATDLAEDFVSRVVAAGVTRIVSLTSSGVTTRRAGFYEVLHAGGTGRREVRGGLDPRAARRVRRQQARLLGRVHP